MENKPQRLDQLEVTKVDEDILVYDHETNEVHCLEEKASLVFSQCDGTRNLDEIVETVQEEAKDVTRDQVEGILDQLSQLRLIRESSWTRREVISKAAAAALVYTIVAPSPAAAQSNGTSPPLTTAQPTTPP
jgi:hypothetical protein